MSSIRAYLARLRNRSQQDKFNYALRASIGVTSAIFVVWSILFFSAYSSYPVTPYDDTATATNALNLQKDFESLKEIVTEALGKKDVVNEELKEGEGMKELTTPVLNEPQSSQSLNDVVAPTDTTVDVYNRNF